MWVLGVLSAPLLDYGSKKFHLNELIAFTLIGWKAGLKGAPVSVKAAEPPKFRKLGAMILVADLTPTKEPPPEEPLPQSRKPNISGIIIASNIALFMMILAPESFLKPNMHHAKIT